MSSSRDAPLRHAARMAALPVRARLEGIAGCVSRLTHFSAKQKRARRAPCYSSQHVTVHSSLNHRSVRFCPPQDIAPNAADMRSVRARPRGRRSSVREIPNARNSLGEAQTVPEPASRIVAETESRQEISPRRHGGHREFSARIGVQVHLLSALRVSVVHLFSWCLCALAVDFRPRSDASALTAAGISPNFLADGNLPSIAPGTTISSLRVRNAMQPDATRCTAVHRDASCLVAALR
jgi:hypothetical protein